MSSSTEPEGETTPPVHKRRQRYSGTHPKRFQQKYKELNPDQYPDEVAKVIASGKTPAGQHLPIMVDEVLDCLTPQPGERVVDCTLGYGGHTQALWYAIQPGGHLLSLDADPVEIVRTETRLRASGLDESSFTVRRCNFAGLTKALAEQNWTETGVDVIFADLGLSSMQIDNPARGFTFKREGPLDMRMNPQRGKSAAQLLGELPPDKLQRLLQENADEPRAELLAQQLCEINRRTPIATTKALAEAIRRSMPPRVPADELDLTIRRVFQALRIAVNEEFNALESLLRSLPQALRSGGRIAILTFHSGEDRRVKLAFQEGVRSGIYADAAPEIIRATPEEQRTNPRSSPAKLRWAIRA
jgi:16S rRNA (cytosine1402-N4)-methyltransferase